MSHPKKFPFSCHIFFFVCFCGILLPRPKPFSHFSLVHVWKLLWWLQGGGRFVKDAPQWHQAPSSGCLTQSSNSPCSCMQAYLLPFPNRLVHGRVMESSQYGFMADTRLPAFPAYCQNKSRNTSNNENWWTFCSCPTLDGAGSTLSHMRLTDKAICSSMCATFVYDFYVTVM